MKAIILAGGVGSRLRPLTFTKPKPMLPLTNKPILEHIIVYLKNHGISDIAVTTNYLRESIMKWFGDGSDLGVRLYYPLEEKPLGTAGSVKNIRGWVDDTCAVIQGDNITDMNLTELVEFHKSSGAYATIGVRQVDNPEHYGVVSLSSEGEVEGFIEKPSKDKCPSDLINTGLYVLEPEALKYIPDDRVFDFARDLFPILMEMGKLYGRKLPGFWADIGNPKGYTLAKEWMLNNLEEATPTSATVLGETRNIVVLGENAKIGNKTVVLGPVVIGDNTKIGDNCFIGPNTCISDNVAISDNTVISGSVVFEDNVVGEKAHLGPCFIGERCVIGSKNLIQPNVLVGSETRSGHSVKLFENARVWPNMRLETGEQVSGTLRKFIQTKEAVYNPSEYLRDVSPEETFYFNKSEDGNVLYTGLKAKSLIEFKDILKTVESSSIYHHLRYNMNDFRDWTKRVICDIRLTKDFQRIKEDNFLKDPNDVLRKRLVSTVETRLNELYTLVTP